MKTIKQLIILAVFSAAIDTRAAEAAQAPLAKQETPAAAALTNGATAVAPSQPESGTATNAAAVEEQPPEAVPATQAAPPNNGTNGLILNFRGAPLDKVLDYLSEAAGFIIVKETQVRGTVDAWSNQPLSKDEAVNLLNSVLKKNGYAAIRNDRTLTIVNRDEAKTHDIPVRFGGDPLNIPRNDEVVTQIIPVRFVEVTQLIKDLQPLVSPTANTMTANEAGNAIVITDTQANIRRLAEIIKDIDSGAEDVTVVKVFHLQHSSPSEMADLITNLFPDDSRAGNSQSPFAFGGPGGFRRFLGGGGFGAAAGGAGAGGAGAGNASQNQRIKKRNRVIAVADQRTASVVVTASKDLMEQIESVVADLDPDTSNLKTVAVFPVERAEPQDVMQVLQDIFQKNGTPNNNRNAQNQQNVLQNRSTQQNQQYNTGTATGLGRGMTGGRGAGNGGGGFGQ